MMATDIGCDECSTLRRMLQESHRRLTMLERLYEKAVFEFVEIPRVQSDSPDRMRVIVNVDGWNRFQNELKLLQIIDETDE